MPVGWVDGGVEFVGVAMLYSIYEYIYKLEGIF